MNNVHFYVFEKIDRNSNKFYTMIKDCQTNPLYFHVAYGRNDKGTLTWSTKNLDEWRKTYNDRINHGYTLRTSKMIDLDFFMNIYDKLTRVNSVQPTLDLTSYWRHLYKVGELTKSQMHELNEYYKQGEKQ